MKRSVLYFLFGIHFLAHTETEDKIDCKKPTGSYQESCINIKIKAYKSSDPLVPPSCILIAECPTMHQGLKMIQNEVFIPATKTPLSDIQNINGTLSIAVFPKLETPSTCQTLTGSYEKTCKTEISPYQSTDENLTKSPLCELKATCNKIGDLSSKQTRVFYDLNSYKEALKIENCDGHLVQSAKGDDRCNIPDAQTIKEIGQKEAIGHY